MFVWAVLINWVGLISIKKGVSFGKVYEDEKSLGQSIRLGSYRSGDAATVSWLITPEIDVGSLNQPHLAFRTSTSFADNSVLEVFYSTEWSGDRFCVNTHWKILDQNSTWLFVIRAVENRPTTVPLKSMIFASSTGLSCTEKEYRRRARFLGCFWGYCASPQWEEIFYWV